MEKKEFTQIYDKFIEEQGDDFHFQVINDMIVLENIQENHIILKAKNEFSRDNFKARYFNLLQEKLPKNTLKIILEKQDIKSHKIRSLSSPNRTIKSQELPFGNRSRSIDNINPKLSFDNYIEGQHNSYAVSIGKALSKEWHQSYSPFFIWGDIGLGKTHLLHAIGNASKNNRKVLYTNADLFLNHFVQAMKTKTPENFKEKYRNVDILLFDDIHSLQNKEHTQEELFSIFEHFHNEKKQLVFTCDQRPDKLNSKKFSARLLSRLKSGGMNIDIKNPSFETRLAILEIKSSELGLKLTHDVIEFLAENICDSIRDLNGALKKIDTFQKILGQKITVAMVSQELQEFFSMKQKPLIVRTIQTRVAAYYQLEVADILSNRRHRKIVLPRQIAIYISRKLTPLSTTELGREFNQNHGTIITSSRKIEKMEATDQKFAKELDTLKKELRASC